MTDKVLGHATAYGYYKAGGGTMTEAEFTEFMADFGTASQTAVEAAQAALASKNAAQTAATTATNKASEATTAATTATNKAAEAQADADAAALDASQALSAASTATTKATEATTAAATATSAKTDAVAANTAAQSAKTAAQTAQTGAETAAASVQSSAAQIATNAEDITQLKSELTALAPKEDMYKAFPTDTASGAVASFADGANVPVKSLIVNIDPVQSGSGCPSPTNVRPISGWSEVNVSHSGADMTNPTVISIQLGQTVYGGTLDVVSGVLTLDDAKNIYDGSDDEDWQVNSVGGGFCAMMITDNTTVNVSANTDTNINVQSDRLQAQSANDIVYNRTAYKVGIITNHRFMVTVKVTDATGVTGFKSWLASNPITVCYKLDTPLTIQLDPHEVTALFGSNNVWADTGDTEVEYRADPTLYVQRKIAEAISALS